MQVCAAIIQGRNYLRVALITLHELQSNTHEISLMYYCTNCTSRFRAIAKPLQETCQPSLQQEFRQFSIAGQSQSGPLQTSKNVLQVHRLR